MPHLDAKALETDPEGMELLRAAIRPQATSLPVLQGLPIRAAAPDRSFIGSLKTVRLKAEKHFVRLGRMPRALA